MNLTLKVWLTKFWTDWRLFLLFVALPIAVLFSPVLFFGKIFLSTDAIDYLYPLSYFFKHHYLSTWNSFIFFGFPLISSFHYAFFNPVYLISFKFFDFITAIHLVLFFDFLAAAVFSYLFARDLGIRMYGALAATLTYVLSQFWVFWMTSHTVSNSIFILPAILFALNRILQGKNRYLFPLSFVIGLGWLSAHYQFVIMALFASVLFFIFHIWKKYKEERIIAPIVSLIAKVSIAGLGSLIIGAPQIYETIKFFGTTGRSTSFAYDYLTPVDLGRLLMPRLDIYHFTIAESLPYIGILSLICLGFGYAYSFRKDKNAFFFGLLLILIVSFLIKFSPTALILKHLPIFKYMSQPARWIYVGTFAAAILAGSGFERLLVLFEDSAFKIRFQKWMRRVVIFFGTLSFSISVIYYFFGSAIIRLVTGYFDVHMFPSKTNGLSLDYYHSLIKILVDKSVNNFTLNNPQVIIFLLVLTAIWGISVWSESLKERLPHVMLCVIAGNLLFAGLLATSVAPRDLMLRPPAAASYIKSRESDPYAYRVLSFMVPFAQYQKILATSPDRLDLGIRFAIEGMGSNMNLLHEISTAGGIDANSNRRTYRILNLFEGNAEDIPFQKKLEALSSRADLLGVFNIKYVVTPYLLSTSTLSLAKTFSVTDLKLPMYVYENKLTRPTIFSPSKVIYLREGNLDGSYKTVTSPGAYYAGISYIECDICEVFPEDGSVPEITLLKRFDTYAEIKFKSPKPRFVVFSETNTPGWKAEIDDKAAPIYFADYVFQAIYVPAGEHLLTFKFTL